MKPNPRQVLTQIVLDRIVDTAAQRGGRCLSNPDAVLANPQEIRWQCALEHPFTLA